MAAWISPHDLAAPDLSHDAQHRLSQAYQLLHLDGSGQPGKQKLMVVPACTGSHVHEIRMLTIAKRLNCLQDNYAHGSTRALNTATH